MVRSIAIPHLSIAYIPGRLCASPLARMVRQRQALENEISIIQKRLDTPRDASTVSFQELSEVKVIHISCHSGYYSFCLH